MKTKVNKLIDMLADKTLSFGCWVEITHDCYDFNKKSIEDMTMIEASFGYNGRCVYIKPDNFLNDWYDIFCFEEYRINKILGHPIMIGDILEKMNKILEEETAQVFSDKWEELNFLWQPCDFTKSLQQIIADSGWEIIYNKRQNIDGSFNTKQYIEQLKNHNARNLVEFLFNIFKLK